MRDAETIWLDGELVPWESVTLHVLSQSAQRASLVFDVMSCHWLPAGPAVLGLREHAERFLRSAALSGMRLAVDLDQVLAGIAEVVHANPGCEVVKMSGYYPTPSLDVLPKDDHASVAIAAFPLSQFGASGVRKPARLQVAGVRKMPDWVMSPQAKLAAGYLYTSIAKAQAREAGFDDVLLLDERGDLAESSTQSFFLVRQGELYTAPLDVVLDGITRRALIEVAEDEGLGVKVERLPADGLADADEAFMVGTTIAVWPVARIDARAFEPCPGPMSARLAARFEALLAGDDELSARWLQPVGPG